MLPLELYGEIILMAGGIVLVKQISKEVSKPYLGMITEYDMITAPITVEEMGKYLQICPKYIRVIKYNNDQLIDCKCFKYFEADHRYYNDEVILGPSNDLVQRLNFMFDRNKSDIEIITNHQLRNYDLSTTSNILQQRTTDKSLINKVCLDTILYYYQILPTRLLWVYLYVNIQAFNIKTKYDYGTDRYENMLLNIMHFNDKIKDNKILKFNNDDVEYYKNLLLDFLQVNIRSDHQYTNYIIRKV